MNQNMVGADAADLRQLAHSFDRAATQMQSTASRVRSGIQTSAWLGAGANRFRASWDADHSVALRRVAGELTTAAAKLRQEADQQERASAASGGSSLHSGVGPAAGAGSAIRDSGDVLEMLKTWGVEIPGLSLDTLKQLKDWGWPDLTSLMTHLNSSDFNSVSDVVHGLKSAGGVLSLLSVGMSAHDLGAAMATSDEPGAWRSGVDMVADVGTSFVPFGGVAWMAGTYIGEGIYQGVTSVYDWEGATYDYAAHSMFGDGYDTADPAQAAAIVQRYEGPAGIAYSITDHLKITEPAEHLGYAIYDGAEAVSNVLGDVGNVIGKAKLPWQH